jgi:putative ABC transport system permease protein
VRFVHGQRSETGAIQGYARPPQLRRVIDVDLKQAAPDGAGLMLTDRLAGKLGVRAGDTVTVEVREGRRPVREVVVERTVRDMMGLNAYMDRQALNRLLGDGDVATLFSLAVERGATRRVLDATQAMPRVTGAFSKAVMLRNMEEITARNVLIMSSLLTTFAAVIAVGVVYNNARIALAERGWELASLRVLGFTRAGGVAAAAGRTGAGHRDCAPAGHGAGLGPHARGGGTDAQRPVLFSGDHPATHLCVGHAGGGGRRSGQRAGRAPADRPAGPGRIAQDKGIRTCRNARPGRSPPPPWPR